MRAIEKRKPKKVVFVARPVCTRVHEPDLNFGPFCCASCLQTVIRPLILTDPKRPTRRPS